MKAAVFKKTQDGRWLPKVEEVPTPQLEDGEVLLRVESCGICQTDLTVSAGRFRDPRFIPEEVILGHEFWGEIVELKGGVNERRKSLGMEPLEVGDLVVADPNIVCLHGEARSWRREGGTCYFCSQFLSALCEKVQHIGVHFNGGFAQYCKLPAEQVVKLPDRDKEFWRKRGYFVEPLACILWGAERLQPEPGMSVAIIGAGPIGSIFA
ncbi:MAG: alcohol dehydrogenase catalytic domain-containing protein, partial [bacterium]